MTLKVFQAFSEAKQKLTFADDFTVEHNNIDLKTELLNEYVYITTKFLKWWTCCYMCLMTG